MVWMLLRLFSLQGAYVVSVPILMFQYGDLFCLKFWGTWVCERQGWMSSFSITKS